MDFGSRMSSGADRWGVGAQVTSMMGLILLCVTWVADVGRTTTMFTTGLVMAVVYALCILGRRKRTHDRVEPYPYFRGIGRWSVWRYFRFTY